jgi:hypothetical protein
LASCHLEHVAAEIVHAAAVEPAAVAPPVPLATARGDALLALRCLGIPLSAADRTVAVAVDPLERLLAPVLAAFDELGAERRACGPQPPLWSPHRRGSCRPLQNARSPSPELRRA